MGWVWREDKLESRHGGNEMNMWGEGAGSVDFLNDGRA